LKRDYSNRGVHHKSTPSERRHRRADRSVSGREIQLPLDRDELRAVIEDSWESLAVELGLLVDSSDLEDEPFSECEALTTGPPERFLAGTPIHARQAV
jgi:hypothetical protein